MVLEKFKKEKVPEEVVELDSSHFSEQNRVSVRIENLDNFSDADRIQAMLRNGNVVFLKIKELREKDINELKRAVDRLRKTVTASNGDIVGVDEDYLIVTPNFARVFRGKVF